MFSIIVLSLVLSLVSGDYHHHHPNVVKEETIGRLYSDVKVDLEKGKYYYHVLKKQHEDQGNGPEYSDDYQKVSAKIIPLKSYVGTNLRFFYSIFRPAQHRYFQF
ncbi:unnamed protein product [Cyprideis torosa]|uniref:Uncharacterized protein n=1 Tax=Cyprideis torosa TaxID=163714 RepID=A0A7R8WC03_9CRUS|nr:unnamed protein product [Cyprideis torosa]CAG0890196.1 unnamed protein product [Cyprideis torosa]